MWAWLDCLHRSCGEDADLCSRPGERRPGRALREFASFYNGHRPHRTLGQAAPLRPLPEPIAEAQMLRLDIRRQDRLGGTLHKHEHAA